MNAKSSFRKAVIITAIATAGCLAVAAVIGLATSGFVPGPVAGQGITVDESKSLPLAGVDLVSIDTVSDDVRVIEGTGDAVVARLHGTVGSSSPDAVPELTAERVGATAQVRLDRKRHFSLGIPWNRLVLDVSVPSGYKGKLEVRSVSADLDVAGHVYDGVTLSTTSGSMRAGAVKVRQFTARTTSGDLNVSSLAAERSEIASVSGSVRLSAVSGDVAAKSVSGSLDIMFAAAPRSVDAQSTSGSVRVQLPADASFTLDAHSTSGNVTCGFPIVVQGSPNGGGGHALVGKVGNGAGQVALRTVSGSIRLVY